VKQKAYLNSGNSMGALRCSSAVDKLSCIGDSDNDHKAESVLRQRRQVSPEYYTFYMINERQ
jgi:hypothetical protein